ncbi:MAG: PaaI family thioesterase [Anaerolineales bacterium]|jgi:acyl-coenzyme A thioesterase PaaI-like protein
MSTEERQSQLQPNSRHCFVCGLENHYGLKLRFIETGPGEVTAYYTVPEHFQGYPGVVHGGIVTAMLDEVTGRAHMSSEHTRFMFTAKIEIRFRKNVPIGQPLKIVGWVEKSKSRIASSIGKIFGPEGDVLAEAKTLLVDLPEDELRDVDLEALGWKVYENEDSSN